MATKPSTVKSDAPIQTRNYQASVIESSHVVVFENLKPPNQPWSSEKFTSPVFKVETGNRSYKL